MFARPKTPTNVWFYTFLASLVAVVTTFVLVSLSYELTNARSALIKACLIAFVTSTPIGWFFATRCART